MDGVRISIDLCEPARQQLKVKLEWTPRVHHQSWLMPSWTPGSYTVRDHAQHLHSLQLQQSGRAIRCKRVAPSCWTAELLDLDPVCLTYTLEARQLTVRTNHLDPDFASLCLPAVVMLIDGERWNPHHLQLCLPTDWLGHLPLPRVDDGYEAKDFDHLVDAPVHAGPFDSRPFTVCGHQHELLTIGEPPMGWPLPLQADIEAVCEAACTLMGTPPPAGDCYQLVIQLLDQGYGGLEHDHSSVLQFSWEALTKKDGYRQLLQLIGHEYFHQWNVRRLRPGAYVPYRYDKAEISDGLWFAEGITSYFDLTLSLLADKSDRQTFLEDLGKDISHVLLNPGCNIQSLADSSREAWLRLYKQTAANSVAQISYYRLGTVISFCLDVQLRQSGSALSCVVRDLWQRLGRYGKGYEPTDLIQAVAAHNMALAELLPTWLETTMAAPIHESLSALGLQAVAIHAKHPNVGLQLSKQKGRFIINKVSPNGPAEHAGLVPGDELIGAHDWRLRGLDHWQALLQGPEQIPVLYARRGRLSSTILKKSDPIVEQWEIGWDPRASSSQKDLRDRWFSIV
ncbi:PDZ domain-containing protein [Synechococcus sp. MVIR-18-1]|uniref:M61 family metallopeptidase n=1 Tax=Synechococcus sp. MVIR-18-1 TaxID=1386941 RepID=UPI001646DF65|nr:PDZ domain-containing protein [Synechococcus sp. MVIR-18-1]QNI76456.1 glycyl aminopeptidase/ M61 family [Synechococcus sp. MVIR-18-1]